MIGLVCLSARAQGNIFDNPDNRTYFGLRLGGDVICPGDYKTGNFKTDLYKNGAGLNAGLIFNLPVWKNMYFEPGIKIYYNNMGVDVEYMDVGQDVSGYKMSLRRSGFRIPLRIGYHFDFEPVQIHVFTGFEPDMAWWGRVHQSMKLNGKDWSSNDKLYTDAQMRRFDIGWQLGAAISYHSWWFEICGNLGMLDLQPGKTSYHQNYCAFTLGYNF